MLVTKKRLLKEVRKAKLEGIAEGKQELERQVEMSKERGIKEGYNRGFTDRTNYYTMSVIPTLRNEINTYEVANKSLREIGERLMFRVGELKDEKENLETSLAINKYINGINENCIKNLRTISRKLEAEKEELEMNNDLYDFQEIKRLEQLMKKVKRVKVKKKIQSRIDKLMIRGL